MKQLHELCLHLCLACRGKAVQTYGTVRQVNYHNYYDEEPLDILWCIAVMKYHLSLLTLEKETERKREREKEREVQEP